MSDIATASPLTARHERLAGALADAGLDALVLNPSPSLTYLTGLHFHLSERPVVGIFTPGGKPVLVLPELEAQKLEGLPFSAKAFTYSEDLSTWERAFREAAEAAGIDGKKVGVEPRSLRVLELRLLEAGAPDASFVSGEDAVAALRMRKDEAELALMRKAVVIAQKALQATLPAVRPGVTEREIAAELILHMLREGSDGELPFQPIIAFGPNSANPHAVPTDYALQMGDLVLFDWGANERGYFSDLTRTFRMGGVDPELEKIAEVVRKANRAGFEAAGPGVPAGVVDQITRKVIEDAGYGEYFVHRTGHGLGMEVHEEPYIRSDNERLLDVGMTFTIEPGIYLPGRGGVRIEDDVVITENGAESLSDLPRGLLPVG